MKRIIDAATLEKRYVEHSALAIQYAEKVNQVHGTNIYVNDAALFLTIKSAYDDVERYKIYHQENPHDKKANSVKRVAYLTKWVLKVRPLHLAENGTDIKNITPHLLNASFCLALARAHISGELDKEFAFSLKTEYELIYDLTFREMTGDSLLSLYQNYYDIVRGENLLENIIERNFKKLP